MTVLERWKPSRIGHGIHAARSEEAMRMLAERGTVLEICPSSNLRTRVVSDLAELKQILATFGERGVAYTLNTDGPYLLDTHLRQEFDLLVNQQVITPAQALRCVETAKAATFIGA
jgi:adenosine deaminase